MISRELFVKTLNSIKNWERDRDLADKELRKLGLAIDIDEEPMLSQLLAVLKEATPDPYDYIGWWLYEAADYIVTWEEDGKEVSANLETPENLYDYLAGGQAKERPRGLPFVEFPMPQAEDGIIHKGIEQSELGKCLDAVLAYIDENEAVIHILEDGKEKYLLIGISQYNRLHGEESISRVSEKGRHMVTMEVEIDADVAAAAEAVLASRGFTLSQACEMFITWCAHYPKDAEAWIKEALARQQSKPATPDGPDPA